MAAQASRFLADQWIVKLRPFSNAQIQSKHISKLLSNTEDSTTSFNCEVRHQFTFTEFKGYSASFNDATKAEIEQMDEVSSIEPVAVYKHCKITSQKDATWGLHRISAPGKVGRAPFTYIYNDNAAGQDTIAYVIDTGINDAHVEFGGRASKGPKFVKSWDRQKKVISDEDKNGHGTHCAGTIGSSAYGVAKKVKIVGIKVFNDDEEPGATNEDIMAAIQYVQTEFKRHGKKSVINLSLGGPSSDALDTAVADAVRSGLVVCVAAGNDGKEAAEKGSPSREPLAITVGASDIDDSIADFSSFGKVVDILAPGVDILSCWITGNTSTETISGTSMATPHVAGVACCLLSDPALKEVATNEVMSQILIQADKNALRGESLKKRTINALVQVNDQKS